MFSTTSHPDRFVDRRIKYLRVIYIVCSVIILFFILRYNFEYRLPQYNLALVPLFICLLSTPLVYRFSQSYKTAAAWVVTFSSALLTVFLFTSGGIQAPGIFWLTTIPFTGGILYGRRGGLISAFGMVCIFVMLLAAEYLMELPNIVADKGIYRQEKFINIICFLFYSLLTTYYFIRNEEIANNDVINNKEELESFMRILVHDIANPTAFIQGGLEEIRESKMSPEDREIILVRMQKNTENILSILNQVRQYKALHDGKMELNIAPTNVSNIIKEILENQSSKIAEKSLVVTMEGDGTQFCLADSVILQNVIISNLISNAIKFSYPKGSIKISVRHVGASLEICIHDSGIGIPASMQNKLFSMTVSTTRAGTLGEKGTGYGLPLAREYALRMNGDLTILSFEKTSDEHLQGTRITLTLPLAPGAAS